MIYVLSITFFFLYSIITYKVFTLHAKYKGQIFDTVLYTIILNKYKNFQGLINHEK